ncbi:MAG: CRTAC1 family protein [Candidatus Latescibacteria bacterium]|nr:CRTAC1 family protein [Candidatus Latescibacterota bacterium]
MNRLILASAGLALILAACGKEAPKSQPPAPTYTEAPSTAYTGVGVQKNPPKVVFTDITAAAGLKFHHQTGAFGQKWMPETMGSGCALFDYDGDERLDILLINSSYWPGHAQADQPTCKLYRNLGKGRFEDLTRQAGLDFVAYGMGVTVADYDADGDPDFFLTTLGPNLLLRNDGGRFSEVAAQAGVQGSLWTDDQGRGHPEWSTSAAWVDADGDGWLDLFVTHYVHWSPETDFFTTMDGKAKSYATPQQYPGSTCRLYRNLGKGRFAEITKEAGLVLPDAKSLGVALADFDGDRDIDLVVTNDTQPNYLLRNLGSGHFEEVGLAAGIAYDEAGRARAGMGVDVASMKNDGVQAIAIGNFSREPVSLYQQTPEGVFIDGAGKGRLVQPTLPSLTFGLRFFDYDLDGYQDLVLANGHIEPEINTVQREITYQQVPQLFWNDGEGQFHEVSQQTGGLFTQPIVGRGLAVGDLDGDGDPDLLITTNGGPAHLLRNDGPTGHAVALQLRGASPNRDAIGAQVIAEAGDLRQQQLVRTGSSYLSHSSSVLCFGLGNHPQVDRLSIRWPDGKTEEVAGLKAGAEYWIEQGKGLTKTRPFAK